MTIEQGDLRLLESETAQRLLASTIPARVAYTALDGTPRIVAGWFEWTGEELVMPTFISAPHVRHPALSRAHAAREPGDRGQHRHRDLSARGAQHPRHGGRRRGRRRGPRVRAGRPSLPRFRAGGGLSRRARPPEHAHGAD